MYNGEAVKTNATEKQEAHENHEAPLSLESPEEIREQMMTVATQETDKFNAESAEDVSQVEAQAEKDGLAIDAEDKTTLQELGVEADAAKNELVAEIIPSKEQATPPPLPTELENIQVKACSSCGKENQGGNKFCEECGNKFEQIQTDSIIQEGAIRMSDEFKSARMTWQEKEDAEFEKFLQEKELENAGSEFKKIDNSLFRVSMGEEKFKEYVEAQKNLPPDAIVHLYHGLNSGGYESALEILNSPGHGIQQRSGPTVSLVPVGQFWKGVGFRYSLRRDQIAFPGEENPKAVVRMQLDSHGDESDGIIISESGSLPLDQFDAEIMRSQFANASPETEKEIIERLHDFSEKRAELKNTEENNNL